jgi:hypothetical protein
MLLPNFNSAKIKFKFEFSDVNGKVMNVCIKNNDTVCDLHPTESGPQYAELDIMLPTMITLIFDGKDNSTDTIIDGNNTIVKDLYVKMSDIWLDNILMPNEVVCKICSLVTVHNDTIDSNYIGFNGHINLDLDNNTVFEQVLSWKRRACLS